LNYLLLIRLDTIVIRLLPQRKRKQRYRAPLVLCFRLIFLFSFLIPAHPSLFSQQIVNYKQLGVSLIRKGDFVQALEKLNFAIQLEPASNDLFFLRGFAKYNLDDYLGAERDYTRSIDLSPTIADAFHYRAIVRSQLLDYKGAFEDFSKAIEINGANPDIYINRARTNLSLKKYYSSLVDCRKAIELKSDQEIVYMIMGTSELGINRYENAIADLDTAIRINARNAYSFAQRGLVWMQLNKVDSAIRDLSQAIRIDSANTYALFNRALAYTKKPDPAAALEDLDNVIRLSPYNSYAYFNKAIVLINMNDKKGAIRNFDYVSKLNPKNLVTYYYRARLKSELKDYSGALHDLDKAVELCPDYGDAYYDRFQIKTKLNDRRGAKEDYLHAMELSKKNPLTPDSVKSEKENYLKSLVKLSGDFEEMNTLNSKFQNQAIDIDLIPMFNVDLIKANVGKSSIYDAYKKGHYFANLIALTNHPGTSNDSIINSEIQIQTHRIDSFPDLPELYYKRAVFYSLQNKYNLAFHDYALSLNKDSIAVIVYLARAYTRYSLIQLIQLQKEDPVQITIGGKAPDRNDPVKTKDLEHTYESVIHDLDKALALDPEFSFAHYNRGFVNCKMGNYKDAVHDFSEALQDQAEFAEAYYNRGLIYILLEDRSHGCEDLSRAGELGILDAYKVMKRYCNN
jgi:tetratricopeptide (TPR) repeat protein